MSDGVRESGPYLESAPRMYASMRSYVEPLPGRAISALALRRHVCAYTTARGLFRVCLCARAVRPRRSAERGGRGAVRARLVRHFHLFPFQFSEKISRGTWSCGVWTPL